MQFRKQEYTCLKAVQSQVQNLEQTQEIRIPEGASGIARILGCWGQPILRSKEWRHDSVQLSGGVLVWVLYEPEDGTGMRTLESWIPFRMDWDLPDNVPVGTMRVQPEMQFMDARPVSAGKVMIRAGICAWAECWSDHRWEMAIPDTVSEEIHLRRQTWPVRLCRETGEKCIPMEETLSVPASIPTPEKMVYYYLVPVISEQKVLGNKLVFRGSGHIHVLYFCKDGELHSWDFEVPFSQYAELAESHSVEAQADVMPVLTNLELESDGEGKLRMKAEFTAQYLVHDRLLLETVEDAMCLHRELNMEKQTESLPVLLDNRREVVSSEQIIPAEADMVTDTFVFTEFPRQRRDGNRIILEQPGTVQILYVDPQGSLRNSTRKWSVQTEMNADPQTNLTGLHREPIHVQVIPGADQMTVRAEVPVHTVATSEQEIGMVTALEPGQVREPDPARPSLILCRSEGNGLWELARSCGSTVEAIQEANGLSGEPEPGRMLLIPVL